jgi:beta-glucan synthesis-associated protein KRE6
MSLLFIHSFIKMQSPRLRLLLLLVPALVQAADIVGLPAKSGVKPWVDVRTPTTASTIVSSRGETWELVMSDEFNVPGRSFAAGHDYLWTALELPDGVNNALEYYSINMTSTTTLPDGRGVFQIEIRDDPGIVFSVYNAYTRPPSFEDHTMYYRAGMVQSWNKFCFQGGFVEVSVQLPGAVSGASGNPDLGPEAQRVKALEYYPTWPGVWLLGNLGRALFTASTNRMWPWSYSECDEMYRKSQRINACETNPKYGLNKRQGRGAPEIDILEGGGTDVSLSIQIAPGMPDAFRPVDPGVEDQTDKLCIYKATCKTLGANFPGIPNATYASRGFRTWYQGLRYAPNTGCTPLASEIQSAAAVLATAKTGFTDNTCRSWVNACPASQDGNADLSRMENSTAPSRRWSINDVGGCMAHINAYRGTYLCDPDNTNIKCQSPRGKDMNETKVLPTFNYQMDALSANTGIPLAAYTGFLRYQVEWVMGSQGYVRWMIEDVVVYEIPAEAIEHPPQDAAHSNPKKQMIEEPLYVILNVAMSASWGTTPPNTGRPCRGDGTNMKHNRICGDFPMYMKVDYIRIYQDTTTMAVGCDPKSHPTKQWIEGHLHEYEDAKNKWIPVQGGAPCFSHDDCTVSVMGHRTIRTGKCSAVGTCECTQKTWGGPRCTSVLESGGSGLPRGFGPPVALAAVVGAVGLVGLLVAMAKTAQQTHTLLRGEQTDGSPVKRTTTDHDGDEATDD